MFDDLFDRIGGPRRVLIGAVGLGVAALILVVSRMASAPAWVPALTGVPLQSASELTDRLDQAGIKYQLDRGGAEILVAQTDLARARVTLAKDGLPGGSRPGLELFDRPSWGMNDFTQRVNFRRALEGELERTIGHMRGIERAEVHLAISEQTAFRRSDDRPASASVVLVLNQGGIPQPDVVQGIARLVSSSVEGLVPENVSVHDESGRMWSEVNDRTGAGLSSRQLRVQQDVEKYLSKKAEDLLSQMVGAGNARVQVAASINFDKVDRTSQLVDPEKQVLANEHKAEITPGAQGGAASTDVTASYDNSKSTEVFSGAIGNLRRLTVAVLVNETRAPVTGAAADSTTNRSQKSTPRTPAELAVIQSLVRDAVGLDSTRGDALSVVSIPFEVLKAVPTVEVIPDFSTKVEHYQGTVLRTAGVLFAFVLGLLTLRAVRSVPQSRPVIAGTLRAGPSNLPATLPASVTAMVSSPAAPPRHNFRSADTQVRDKVIATVDENPEGAARLVKAWIKEG